MPVFSITADQHRPSEGDGFVRAETIQEAVALIGHPDVNVSPLAQLCAAWMSARPNEPECPSWVMNRPSLRASGTSRMRQ